MDFGKGVIRTVGSEIDRLESELKELVPGARVCACVRCALREG